MRGGIDGGLVVSGHQVEQQSAGDGQPDVVPVGFRFDGTHFWVGGYNPTDTRRTRNIQDGHDKVALVIDDLAPGGGWRPRYIRVYGTAELVEQPPGSGTLVMKITPTTSWSLNLDAEWSARGPHTLKPRRGRHD